MKNFAIIWGVAHSPNVAGKQSPDGSHRESVWSLNRCNELKALCDDLGIISHVLQPASDSMSGRVAFVRAAEAIAKDYACCLLISIHNNAAGMGQWMEAHGFCVYTTRGITQSDKMATVIFNNLHAAFPALVTRKDMSDGDPDFEENFTVLMGANYYAVLIEWMFQDNKEDLKVIEDPANIALFNQTLIQSVQSLKSSYGY